jgi:S1-C subfamily serine protease
VSDAGISTATDFHEGNVCPACQEEVHEGDPIHVCSACGVASHQSCWQRERGCNSYFCRKQRRGDVSAPADIVITRDEAAGLPEAKLLPPTTAYPEGREGRYPRRNSRLAILSLLLGVPASVALAAAITYLIRQLGQGPAGLTMAFFSLVLTAGLWLVCIGLSVAALASISGNSQLKGRWLAVSAVVVDIALVVLIPAFGVRGGVSSSHMAKVEFRDPPEAIDNVKDPAIRGAMRANVLVRTSGRGLLAGGISGSGVVVALSKDRALILTNRHVIDPAYRDGKIGKPADAKIEVIFCGKERVDAKVKWHHPQGLDLAMLECRPTDLKHPAAVDVHLPSTVSIGADVFAVGNPMEHGWTYTKGVISSVRERVVGSLRVKIYQTQTPINQGNSGGGLYDMKGRLVGINSWTLSKHIAENLNFAIAVEAAREALAPLLKEPGAQPEAPSDEAPKG